jgi:hypothetical protein
MLKGRKEEAAQLLTEISNIATSTAAWISNDHH